MQSPIEVVRTILDARRTGNHVMVHAHCTEAMTFTFNADPDFVGVGTTCVGWAAISAHFARVDQNWEHLSRRIVSITAAADNPDKVIVQIAFSVRHRASNEPLDGIKRQEWHVRDGIATRMDEILDAPELHAFQRLAASKVPSVENATPM
jgi:ketosteroid isomerase-like protein